MVQVAIILIFRYSAAIANWDSQEIDKLENLCMLGFKKAWKVNASLPDVTFWVGPQQGDSSGVERIGSNILVSVTDL